MHFPLVYILIYTFLWGDRKATYIIFNKNHEFRLRQGVLIFSANFSILKGQLFLFLEDKILKFVFLIIILQNLLLENGHKVRENYMRSPG